MCSNKQAIHKYWSDKLEEDLVRVIDDIMECRLLEILGDYSEDIKGKLFDIVDFMDTIQERELL